MSSKVFSEYVQSTAFSLTLSRRMIDALYFCKRYGFIMSRSTLQSLQGRGLIESVVEDRHDGPRTVIKLTEAGEAILPLLKLAGLNVDYGEPPVIQPPPEVKVKLKVDY